jgi:hypothetical protein
MENQPQVQEGLEPKTSYTKEEVDALLQSESDKRVTQALKKAKEESKKQLAEAEKLAKMNQEDKYKYELEAKEAEIAKKEAELNIRENKIQALKIMADKGIPAELVDYITTPDADETLSNINIFHKAFKAAVQAEVLKVMPKQGAPKAGVVLPHEMTKDEFSKLTFSQRVQLMNDNPELYNRLK